MFKKTKRFLSLVLCASFCSAYFMVFAMDQKECLTISSASEIIEKSSKFYNSIVDQDLIQNNLPKEAFEKPYATNAAVYVMLSNAFKPSLLDSKILPIDIFPDISAGSSPWAKKSIILLKKRGLLTEDEVLKCEEYTTYDELYRLLGRFWEFFGNNPKDDFYAWVNKSWLDSVAKESGKLIDSSFFELEKSNFIKFKKMLEEVKSNCDKDDIRQKTLSTYISCYSDTKRRNSEKTKPLENIFSSIENAETLDKLFKTEEEIIKNTSIESIFSSAVDRDIFSEKKYSENKERGMVLFFGPVEPIISKDLFFASLKKQKAYMKYLENLLVLSGENRKDSQEYAKKIFSMEKQIWEKSINENEDLQDYVVKSNIFEIEKIFPKVNVKNFLIDIGFNVSKDDNIMFVHKNAAIRFSNFITKENVKLLQKYIKVNILSKIGWTLSQDFEKQNERIIQEIFGVNSRIPKDEAVVNSVLSLLPEYSNSLYVEKYFVGKTKDEVEKMVAKIRDTYTARLEKVDWMNEETKDRAIEKLKAMRIHVAYPDEAPVFFEIAENESLFEDVIKIYRAKREAMIEEQNLPTDTDSIFWNFANVVNAFYAPYLNEVFLPFGILGPPIYKNSFSSSENYGKIGVIIGHEIGHALDVSGSQYNEVGNLESWWTTGDHESFNTKCDVLVDFFDGLEIIPGVESNGKLTLSENMADLCGVTVALETAKKEPDYNSKVFFESYGQMWKCKMPKECIKLLCKIDVHSNWKIRVKRVCQVFDDFYIAYDVQPGDGMYLSKEEREKVRRSLIV